MTVGCKNPCEDIERLCVCGTCKHWSEAGGPSACFVDARYEPGSGWDSLFAVGPSDPCHFTPSKWRPYWESDAK